jgi:hypothetical protein
MKERRRELDFSFLFFSIMNINILTAVINHLSEYPMKILNINTAYILC